MLVAVDSGKYMTKAIAKGTKYSVRSRTEEEPANSGRGTVIEYRDQVYLVGQEAEKTDFDGTKAKPNHKVLTYVAIANLLTQEDCENGVELVTGCSLDEFMNVERRDALKRFYEGESNVEFLLNGTPRWFKINNVIILPESVGVVYRDPPYFKNRLVGVIDIGGLNTNAAVYENMKPVKSYSFTINEGGNMLSKKLKTELNRVTGDPFQDIQIPYILSGGASPLINETKEKVLNDHFEKIMTECKAHNWDLHNWELWFTGGSSQYLFKSIIQKQYPRANVSDTGEWDNVTAYYSAGQTLENAKKSR
jgi:plasmid segregation protein ParM